jgi:hypothetical protein
MPRPVLKMVPSKEPLPPHEQSILNSLVFTALCTPEIFSILSKVGLPQREQALRDALDWSFTHDLVSDENK